MSAFVQHPTHIDLMLTHALPPLARFGVVIYKLEGMDGCGWGEVPLEGSPAEYLPQRLVVSRENATALGASLLAENIRSVQYRYSSDEDMGTLPGPVGLPDLVHGYQFQALARDMPAVGVLKALDGYEYQSCEHPGWSGSFAQAFCDTLRGSLIGRLPGYEDAPTWAYVQRLTAVEEG